MRPTLVAAAVLLSLASCKKDPPPSAPPPDASAPAAQPVKPAEPAAPGEAKLSLFEPKGGRCEWLRLEAPGKTRTVVASFEGDCRGARLAWSEDSSKALVWFDPANLQREGYFSQAATPAAFPAETPDETAKPRLFAVTVATGDARALAMPTVRGELRELALDAKGEPLAFAEETLSEEQSAGTDIDVEGQRVALEHGEEGMPALAHVYRLSEGTSWRRAETRGTSIGADFSAGWRDTEAAKKLAGFRSMDQLAAHVQGDSVEDPALLARLAAQAPRKAKPEDGNWVQLGSSAGKAFVWEVSGDFAYSTGRVVFDDGQALFPAPGLGFTDGDLVALRTEGPFLLVSAQDVGTHPRLYDLRTRTLVFGSDTARAATFWPGAPKPEHPH